MEKQGVSAPRLALVGFRKDASSYYLGLFPDWRFSASERQGEIDATSIRQRYFEPDEPAWEALQNLAPSAVVRALKDWAKQPAFAILREEHRALIDYRKRWGSGPFITLDALVTAARHVLLIRRGNTPGKGLWAVPGGFLEDRERLLQGAIRELKEETGLTVTETDLVASLREVCVFDHPDRSQRGRIITHAHWFDLPLDAPPVVAGADDAAEARWFPIDALAGMEADLFEDHFVILERFLELPDTAP
jgi:bifunctional NMN adenylyltransferase/nudix hydrolase